MIVSIYNNVEKLFSEFAKNEVFFTFYNVLIGIVGIYITIWLVIGGIKVMKGEENINSLGYNVGKFFVISLIVAILCNPIKSPISPIYNLLTTTVKEKTYTVESTVTGSYFTNVSVALESFKTIFSTGVYVFEDVSEKTSKAFHEVYYRGKNGIPDHRKEGLLQKVREDYISNLNTTMLKYDKQRTALNNETSRVCAEDKLKLECDIKKKQIEKITNNIKELFSIRSEPQLVNKFAENFFNNALSVLSANDKDIASEISDILTGIACFLFWLPCIIITTVFLVKFMFQLLELGLTFLISVGLLLLSMPIAAAALLYGKWFKDIFQKWFALSVGNFITIPIVLICLILCIKYFPNIDISSWGIDSVIFTENSFHGLVRQAIIGSDNNPANFTGIIDQYMSVLKLVIVLWAINMITTGVKKFLDDLVGNSFNFTSGAGALGGAAAMAAGGAALKATAATGKAAVGGASVLGNVAGSLAVAGGKISGTAGLNTMASGYSQLKQGNVIGGIARMAIGGAGAVLGGSSMLTGGLTKGGSGIAKQLSGKAGDIGANATKTMGKGAIGLTKFGDKLTGSHGASLMRNIGGKIAASGAKSGNEALSEFGKMMAKSGKSAGGARPKR